MSTTDRLRKITTDFTLEEKKGVWIASPHTVLASAWCLKLCVPFFESGSPYVLRALIEANGMTVEG